MRMDFDIFKLNGTECFSKSGDEIIIKDCDYINRLIHGLKYYQLLQIANNRLNDDIFADFSIERYRNQMITDWIHFISVHSNDLDDINAELVNDANFGECSMENCVLFERYYNERGRRLMDNKNKTETGDPILLFYSDLYDNMHHYLYHLYDIGLRIKHDDDDETETEDEIKCVDEWIDTEFNVKQKIIATKKEKIGLKIDRFNDDNEGKNKFNLSVIDNNKNGNNDKETMMDSFYQYIESNSFPENIKMKLFGLLQSDCFDSDGILYDLNDKKESNIINIINHNKKYCKLITDYITDYKCM